MRVSVVVLFAAAVGLLVWRVLAAGWVSVAVAAVAGLLLALALHHARGGGAEVDDDA